MDATELAKQFHESYERLAPSFGYETRPDTRAFDPESANGRLMIAVCEEMSFAKYREWEQMMLAMPFTAGLVAMREMQARFVEHGGHPEIAQSIRLNWSSSWGADPSLAGKDSQVLEDNAPQNLTARLPSISSETTWFDDGSVEPSPAVKRAMDTYQRKLNVVQEKRDEAGRRYDADAIFALLVCAISRKLEELGLKPADAHQAATYLERGKS